VTAGDGLQNGGAVSLGGSVTLAVGSSVVRTTGAQSLSGALSLTNTTQSTSSATGALIVAGGVGIAKDVYCDGTINALAFNATSDATLKANIQPIDNALDMLGAIRPVSYTFKGLERDGTRYGVLAQDLCAHGLGSIVHENPDGKLSVDYNNLVGLLIGAVKELQAEVAMLKISNA
jgi:hypothetical protein